MLVKIEKRKDPFARIDRRLLQDKRLSFRARGVLGYLLSHPDTWEARIDDIVKNSPTEGTDSIRSVMRELYALGYAKAEITKDDLTGLFKGKKIIVFEAPTDLGLNPTSVDRNFRQAGDILTSDKKQTNENNCPPLSRTDGIGFFPVNSEVSHFIKTASSKLEDFVRSSRRLNRSFSRIRWYKEFQLLLHELSDDKKRLKQVLKSYIEKPHDKFTPIADSAGSFRKKFTSIEAWITRQEEEGSVPHYKETITKATKFDFEAIPE